MRLSRLFSIVALFALLFAPAGMLGSHSAMAMPHDAAAPMSGHCDTKEQAPDEQPGPSMIDCAIACSAMPSADPFVPQKPLAAAARFKTALTRFIAGTRPEAATPPPRIA
jgi:hypothetical protein